MSDLSFEKRGEVKLKERNIKFVQSKRKLESKSERKLKRK